MKKIIYKFSLLFIPAFLFAQESQESKIDVSFSHGVSYIDYRNKNTPLHFYLPYIGYFYEVNIDYKIGDKAYMGVGYSNQQHTIRLNQIRKSPGMGVILDNYANIGSRDIFDIHYRRLLTKNLHFTLGVYGYSEILNRNGIDLYEEQPYYVFRDEKDRLDNFGLFGSVEYYFDLTKYAQLGVKGKLYYSFVGIETIALLPTLRVKF